MTLILTLVRHGESTDNLKALWAGHRDAPLTTHGMNQARRLGKSFEDVYISKIYASDLKRAHWTALQIATQNKSLLAKLQNGASESDNQFESVSGASRPSSSLEKNGTSTPDRAAGELEEDQIAEMSAGPSSLATTDRLYSSAATVPDYTDDFSCSSSAAASSPVPSPSSATRGTTSTSLEALLPKTVTTTNKLREQYFGLAEGQSWKTGFAISGNHYHNRGYKFEQGESLEDVHERAQEIIRRCVIPWLVKSSKNAEGRKEHIVLVAHGIMISELLYALHRLQDPRVQYERRSGHTNTGWTRFTLSLPANFHSPSSPLPSPPIPDLLDPELPPHYDEILAPKTLPQVTIKQTHANVTTHLDGLKRTKGGVGSEGFDARQKSLRDFFSGASTSESTPEYGKKDEGAKGASNGTPAPSKAVPDPRPIDLTGDDKDDDIMKTNGEHQRRGVRLTSPTSPSPKKSRLT